MDKKNMLVLIMLAAILSDAYSQITIEECHRNAAAHYPLSRQYRLIDLTEEYSLESAASGYLPRVSFSAKGTYQSEVTEIPLSIPGIEAEKIDKDQYQAAFEVSQLVWDGGVIRSLRKAAKYRGVAERSSTEAGLYAVRERVNQIYFGILLIDEKLRQNEILRNELRRNYSLITAYIEGGIASRPDADTIRVEELSALRKKNELSSLRKAYCGMLSEMTGSEISDDTVFIRPGDIHYSDETLLSAANRPEVAAYAARKDFIESKKDSVISSCMPKITLFMQGGYGKPGLNMMSSDFSLYSIGGVRVVWDMSGFYTMKKDLMLIEMEKESVSVSEDTFLHNSNIEKIRALNEIEKTVKLIENDDEIIILRERIKASAGEKVKNGTLSVSEFVREINACDSAVQDKVLHEIQLLMAVYELKYILNI